jgi:hypothetical protein
MVNMVLSSPSKKMIPDFNKGAEKCDFTWSDSFAEFENVLQGHHRTAWKQVLHEHFPEPVDETVPVPITQDCNLEENFHWALQLFIQKTLKEKKPRDRQYIYLHPGGGQVFQKPMMQVPVNHLRWFNEMNHTAEALPEGDMQPPNKALQLKWFFMLFHSKDCAKYVEREWCFCDKTLESVAEHFENIYNSQVADGSLQRKASIKLRIAQNAISATRLRSITRRRSAVLRTSITGVTAPTADKARHIIFRTTSERDATTAIATTPMTIMRRNRRTRFLLIMATRHSSLAQCMDQRVITPSKSATKNPPKQDKCQVQDKKCQYEVHHNDARFTSDDNEPRASVGTPVPSENHTSASSEGKINEDENYHLHIDKKMKVGGHMPRKSDHQQHRSKSKSSQKGKKEEASSTFMDNDLDFTDTVLIGLDSLEADLKEPKDITNPFDFGPCQWNL